MTMTRALITTSANPAAAAPATPSPAAAANPAVAALPETGAELLPVNELLRLLEQHGGFAQALASAGAPAVAQPAARAEVPQAAAARRQRAAGLQDDEAPCDIVTLMRLLESQAATQPPTAAAAVAANGGRRANTASDGAPADDNAAVCAAAASMLAAPRPFEIVGAAAAAVAHESGSADTQSPMRAVAGPERSATLAPPGASADTSAADDLGAMLTGREVVSLLEAGGAPAAAGLRHDGPPAAVAATTPSADPAQVTLGLARSLQLGTAVGAPVERLIHVPVRDPAWPQAVAAQIQFLAEQKIEAATLRLSPEHLGPVEVRIDVRDNGVSVSFGAAHGDTRLALEQALPRLREMFAAAGLHLGQASVQQEARRSSHPGGGAPAPGADATDNSESAAGSAPRGIGLVDEYA